MTHLWVRAESRPNEDRVGITPDGVRDLIRRGFRVTVEDSPRRILPTEDYRAAGAAIAPEGSWPDAPQDAIIFGLANPTPEVHPVLAHKYARVVATGRSDFPNQINNVLAFPGVFRGALDAGARRITEKMKVAAAEAIFSVVGDDLAPDHIVPSPLDPRVGPAVAAAVAAAAEV